MKRYIAIGIATLAVLLSAALHAQTPISGLPAAGSANTSDEIPANQAGTTRKVTAGQIAALEGPIHYCTSATGTDTYVGTCTPTLASYTANLLVKVLFSGAANTGAATLNLDTVGALSIYKHADGTELADNDIRQNVPVVLAYCAACNSAAGAWMLQELGNAPTGGGGTPGGSDTQLQYNNASAFGGVAGSVWNGTLLTLPSLTVNNALQTLSNVTDPVFRVTDTDQSLTVEIGAIGFQPYGFIGTTTAHDFRLYGHNAHAATATTGGGFQVVNEFTMPVGAAPVVNAFGELAGDNNLWAASRGAPVFFDGTAAVGLVGTLVSDVPTNGQVPKWNTGGTITWEDDSTGAGFGETSLSTLANNQTLWDSASASRTLTAGLSGATDPVITFADDSVAFNVPVSAPSLIATGPGGNQITGESAIAAGATAGKYGFGVDTDTDRLATTENGGSQEDYLSANDHTETIQFLFYNGGAALATSQQIALRIPWGCTITDVETVADQSGSLVVDIWVDTFANFPPTDVDSITASAPPTLSTAQTSSDATLTGWTIALTGGSWAIANVDSATTVTWANVSLQCTRTP